VWALLVTGKRLCADTAAAVKATVEIGPAHAGPFIDSWRRGWRDVGPLQDIAGCHFWRRVGGSRDELGRPVFTALANGQAHGKERPLLVAGKVLVA